MSKSVEVKAEAIRLRCVERKSLNEIQKATGASKGALSLWLRAHPLTPEELKHRQRTNGAMLRSARTVTLAAPAETSFSTKQTGDVGVQTVVLRALEYGFAVLTPLGDRLPYDLAFDVHGSIKKIQVKVATRVKNHYTVHSTRTHATPSSYRVKRYTHGDFDFAAVFVRDTRVVYVIPAKEFISRTSVSIGSGVYGKVWADQYKEAWHLLTCTRE